MIAQKLQWLDLLVRSRPTKRRSFQSPTSLLTFLTTNRLEGKDLKNLLKNFGITHDNDLNKSTYGATGPDLLSNFDGTKVPRIPVEVTSFSQTVARYFAQE